MTDTTGRVLRAVVFAIVLTMLGVATVMAGAPGNNGTLKVHEFGTPSGTESNDPKVCNFNFEGFGFDADFSGFIVIEGQGQTEFTSDPIAFGPTDETGYAETEYMTLPAGHYKATLYGKDTGGGINLEDEKAKSKVFKSECPEATPTPSPTASPTPTPTPEPTPSETTAPSPTENPPALGGGTPPTPNTAMDFQTSALTVGFVLSALGVLVLLALANLRYRRSR